MRSTAEAFLDFRTLSGEVLWIALGSVLLAAFGTALIARGITRPVRALEQAARRLAGGDYAVDLPLADRGEIGELAREFGRMQQGIRERESAIHHLAYHDDLTGLPNRNRFRVEVAEAIAAARRAPRPPGGGAARPRPLQGHQRHPRPPRRRPPADAAGEAARGRRRRARAGGGAPRRRRVRRAAAGARACARPSRRSPSCASCCRRRWRPRSCASSCQASIGIALFPDHGGDPASLLRAGRGGDVRRQGEEARHRLLRRQPGPPQRAAADADGRAAPRHRDRRAAPLLPAQGRPRDRRAGRGARRWCAGAHPRLGAVSPAEFVPLAEQTGAIRPLTRWVLRRALAEAAAWHRERRAARRGGQPLGARPPRPRPAAAVDGRPRGGELAGARTSCSRSPRAASWPTPRRRAGCSARWWRWGSPCRSTTSAPATRRWRSSGGCRCRSSRSTAPSCSRWRARTRRPPSCAPPSRWRTASGCGWSPRASRAARSRSACARWAATWRRGTTSASRSRRRSCCGGWARRAAVLRPVGLA